MEIKTTRVLTQEERAFITGRFQNLGIYVNQIAHNLQGSKYSASACNTIRYKITLLYEYLSCYIQDVNYIQDEKETLLRALDTLNPAQFQNLIIIIQQCNLPTAAQCKRLVKIIDKAEEKGYIMP